jgi:hypothetical protein
MKDLKALAGKWAVINDEKWHDTGRGLICKVEHAFWEGGSESWIFTVIEIDKINFTVDVDRENIGIKYTASIRTYKPSRLEKQLIIEKIFEKHSKKFEAAFKALGKSMEKLK